MLSIPPTSDSAVHSPTSKHTRFEVRPPFIELKSLCDFDALSDSGSSSIPGSPRTIVPQLPYKKSGKNNNWVPKPSVLFHVRGNAGVFLIDAVNKKFQEVDDRDDPPFSSDCQGITIRMHVRLRNHGILHSNS